MLAATITTDQPARPQKRLACDDCRARKVQCSGENTGCARCRRAGIECIYSPPKPPGRPRKVRRVEQDDSASKKRSYSDTGFDMGGPLILGDQFGGSMGPLSPEADFSGFFGGMMGGGFGYEQYGLVTRGGTFSGTDSMQSMLNGSGTLPSTHEMSAYSMPIPSVTTPKSANSSLSSISCINWPSSPGDDTSHDLTPASIPCTCLPAFFNSIAALRQPPTDPNNFSLPSVLATLREALRTINTSTSCAYCHTTVQSTYVCMMMLGTLLPLLLLFIETSVSTISRNKTLMHTVQLTIDGTDKPVPVELSAHAWEELAKDTIRKEFVELNQLIARIDGILQRRYCSNSTELSAVAAGQKEMGVTVVKELQNGSHSTGEPPFCVGLLTMIRGMAERVKARVGD